MRTLYILVTNKTAKYNHDDGYIVCGNSDYQIEFTFDEEWDAYENKIARFVWGGKHFDVAFTGNVCPVPIIKNAHSVKVGVFAGNLSTTTKAVISCKRSILCGDEPPHEEEEAYQATELEKTLAEAQTSASEAKASAESAKASASEAGAYATVVERVAEEVINSKPHIVDGYWWIGETNTGVKAEGEDGHTPEKGVDYFDGNPGYTPEKGVDYFDGETPYIKDGYWWIGETNTGVKAEGEPGYTPQKNVDYFDGKDGESGVHVGSNPPDTDANVWIDPEDTPTGTAEEWKFTLEDGTVVTKTIAVIG